MPQVSKTIKIGLSATDKQNMSQEVYERLLDLTFPEYSTSETYREGIFVVYNNQLYKCIGSTGGAWDSSKWQLATLNDLLEDIESAVAFVNGKANVDGNYPTLTSGLALNLDSKLTLKDQSAFTFRTTAGAEEIGDPAKVNNIIGGTIFWNQLFDFVSVSSYTSNNCSYEKNNGNLIITPTDYSQSCYVLKNPHYENGHKCLVLAKASISSGSGKLTMSSWVSSDVPTINRTITVSDTKDYILSLIQMGSGSGDNFTVGGQALSSGTVIVKSIMVIDLTTMLGSTIADYIYNLEQTTDGAGVAWFKKYFPKTYYAYCQPTPMHVKISGIRMNRFNQWDEEWEVGALSPSTGEPTTGGTQIRSKNFIRVIPNSTIYGYCEAFVGTTQGNIVCNYYDENKNFISYGGALNDTTNTIPSNVHYIKIWTGTAYGTTYNHDICINLHWDGERDGEYEEYFSELYPVDDIELKGIPMIDSEGNLYFDGDKYWYDGTVDKEWGEYTFSGNESATPALIDQSDSKYRFACSVIISTVKKASDNEDKDKIRSSVFANVSSRDTYVGNTGITVGTSGYIYIYDSANDSSTSWSAIVAKLAGTKIFYKKATPTQSSATPFTQVQSRDNWGTEEIVDAHTGDVEMPTSVSHEYLPDLKAKVESAPANPDNDGDYVMHREDGVNEYTPLSTWLSDNGYEKQVDLSSQITDVAGLTYSVKKAYKVGNVVTLTIVAKNGTGNTIAKNSTLFSLGTLKPSTTLFFDAVNYASRTRILFDAVSGNVQNYDDAISNNEYIYLCITYIL